MMTDLQIVSVALGNMIAMFDALDPHGLDEEDIALVEYARRVQAAAEANDMVPIRKEIAEEDEKERAGMVGALEQS